MEALWGIYDADCLKMLLPLYSQGINGETCTSLDSDGDDDDYEENEPDGVDVEDLFTQGSNETYKNEADWEAVERKTRDNFKTSRTSRSKQDQW